MGMRLTPSHSAGGVTTPFGNVLVSKGLVAQGLVLNAANEFECPPQYYSSDTLTPSSVTTTRRFAAADC